MTVLTGGAGYIGSQMALELLKQGYDIVVIDNYSNSGPKSLEKVRKLSGKDFPVYVADLRDGNALDKVFSENKIDCVIHFAGLKAVGESVSKPLSYYNNNILSTLSMCDAMNRHSVNKIIFSSSATVYKGGNEMPLTENSATGDCTNPYGWTKYMIEQIIRDTAAANPDWSAVFLRYFNVIGADPSGEIGEDPSGIPNNILPAIAHAAVGRLPVFQLRGNDYPTPDGTCIRDYIHVVDLVLGHIAAITYCDKNKGSEAFNLGTGRGTSNWEMIRAFEAAMGKPLNMEITDRRPGDLPVSYTSTEKAAKMLNWRAKKTVEEACADVWRWQSRYPNGYN